MNIRDALLGAKERGTYAYVERYGHTTILRPIVNKMPEMLGGGDYDDFIKTYDGLELTSKPFSWDDLISDEWKVKQ